MAHPNPGYDPNWRERHHRHAVQREDAWQQVARLIKAGQMQSDAYKRADNRWRAHLAECNAAIIAQHETVQDCAAWRVSSVPSGRTVHDVSVAVRAQDFSKSRKSWKAAIGANQRSLRPAIPQLESHKSP
jgi:uncharacterized protein YhaN